MCKRVPVLGIALSLLLPAAAQAEGSYLKAGVGRSNFDVGQGFDDSATGALLAYGVAVDKTWGIEGGYVNFGRIDALDLEDNPISIRTQALYVAATGSIPLGQSASLYGKLGVAAKRFSGSGESETKVSPMAGVGATMSLGSAWGVALEHAHYGKTEGLTLTQTSLSVLYAF